MLVDGNVEIDGILQLATATLPNDDLTPDVSLANVFRCATGHTAARTITMFDGGSSEQLLLIVGGNPTHKTTIQDGANMNLRGNWVEADTATILLFYNSFTSSWNEIARSPGTGGGGNADTLDGLDSTQFLRSDESDEFTGDVLTISGALLLDNSTLPNDDLTPDVSSANVFRCATGHTAPRTITMFDGAPAEQLLLIVGGDPTHKTTIQDGANMNLRGDWVEVDTATILLYYNSFTSAWHEISRSPESAAASGIITTTFADGDLTPTVAGPTDVAKTANTTATTIRNLEDGVDGQVLVIKFNDDNTTLEHLYGSGDGQMRLQGARDFTGKQYDTLTLVYDSADGKFWETGRSLNTDIV